MRVLVLGMPRTGTDCKTSDSHKPKGAYTDLSLALKQALKSLGYNDVYHGYSTTLENARDCQIWLDACNAKFKAKGKPFGRDEFDQLLGHCQVLVSVNCSGRTNCEVQAVSDFPALAFAPELVKAYPEAKVILTIRDVDSWHE
jgi:hypothetical protein